MFRRARQPRQQIQPETDAWGTPKWLEDRNYSAIRHAMLGRQTSDDGRALRTFPACMAEILGAKPQAIVLPASSAVPLADSIRGFYDARSQQPPKIGYIRSDTSVSHFGVDPKKPEKRITEETPRLKREFGGLLVAILDHYTSSGGTLEFAEEMLTLAGARQVLMCKGPINWYVGVMGEDVKSLDLSAMTLPRHQVFMHEIGQEASELIKVL